MAEIKECHYCCEKVVSIAKKCKHCGEWLNNGHSSKLKSKKLLKNVSKYLLEISVIVIGVAITLSMSHWLSIRNEKRDIVLYLDAIKLELEENISSLDGIIERLKPDVRYSNYLRSHDKKSLNKDTIESYVHIAYEIEHYTMFQTTAFEMLKNSGTMRLINDKEMLLSLWNFYQMLNSTSEILDLYFQIRMEEFKKEIPLLIEGQRADIPMYYYYMINIPSIMMWSCEKALRKSMEIKEKLENVKI